jgi:hypothetical protein
MSNKKASVKEDKLEKVNTEVTEATTETPEKTEAPEVAEEAAPAEEAAEEEKVEATSEVEDTETEEAESTETVETTEKKSEETEDSEETTTAEEEASSEEEEASSEEESEAEAETEEEPKKEDKKPSKKSKQAKKSEALKEKKAAKETDEPASDKEEKEDKKEVKSDDTDNKSNKKFKFSMNEGLWLLLGLVAGILIGYILLKVTVMTAIDKLSSGNDTTDIDVSSDDTSSDEDTTSDDDTTVVTGITTYEYDSVIISDADEIKAVQDKVALFTDAIINNNTYAQVQTGDSTYSYYLYNDNGEIFTQDSDNLYTEIFLNTGKVYKYSSEEESLSVGEDTEIVAIMNNAIQAVGNDGVTLYKMTLDSDDSETTDEEYRVDLVGRDAVKLLYSSMSDEFADVMVDAMIEALSADDTTDETDEESTEESTETEATTETEEWEPHVIMVFYLTDDVLSSYSYCMFVMDGTEYTNWVLQGFDYVDSWSLDTDWYSYDPEADEDGTTFTTLTTNLITDVNTVMASYAEAQGWDLSDYYDDVEELEIDASDIISSDTTETTETVETTEE